MMRGEEMDREMREKRASTRKGVQTGDRVRGQFVPHFLSFLLIVSSILLLRLNCLRRGMRMSVQEAVCFACCCRWSLGNLYPRTTALMNHALC